MRTAILTTNEGELSGDPSNGGWWHGDEYNAIVTQTHEDGTGTVCIYSTGVVCEDDRLEEGLPAYSWDTMCHIYNVDADGEFVDDGDETYDYSEEVSYTWYENPDTAHKDARRNSQDMVDHHDLYLTLDKRP